MKMNRRKQKRLLKKGGAFQTPPNFDDFKAEIVGDAVILLIARGLLARRFPEIEKYKYAKITWILVSNKELNVIAEQTKTAPAIHKCETWKNAASGFEVRVGKIFIQKGFTAARNFVEPLFLARFDIPAMAASFKARNVKLNAIYKPNNGNFTQTEN